MSSIYQEKIQSVIQSKVEKYQQNAKAIYERPEICNTEYFASSLLANTLKEEEFEVVQSIAGHETGFLADRKSVV